MHATRARAKPCIASGEPQLTPLPPLLLSLSFFMKQVISSSGAPAAVGPYSQAILAGELLFCAGQIPLDPATGELVPGDATAQTERVCANIRAVLATAGLDFSHVVKTTVFLIDLADFAAMNAVYAAHFTEPFPARSTIQVAALPKGARVEIEVLARRPL